jgi:methylenetetrahydrofolate dehydrogenase (NADP+)/methenyltetrahydrofolate cyclohydrolase
MAKIIDGNRIAEDVGRETAAAIQELKRSRGVTPGLAVVLAGSNPASRTYVKNKDRAAREIGIDSRQYSLADDVTMKELLELLGRLNADPSVHAILVQLPLPGGLLEKEAIDAVSPEKDADGLHSMNLGRLLRGEEGLRPCTPLGIRRLIDSTGVEVGGSRVVVIGRSNLVGKPIACMLAEKGVDATVTLCHSRTRDLASVTRQADILIAAAGKPGFVTADMVKEGAVVIDVGMNRVEDPTRSRGYRNVGDVLFEEVEPKCSHITPVPGGVGPMTIAMLLSNTVACARASIDA